MARTIARLRVRSFAAIFLLLATAVLAFPAPALAKRTLGRSAVTFEFNVAAGQTGQGELLVTNDGDENGEIMGGFSKPADGQFVPAE